MPNLYAFLSNQLAQPLAGANHDVKALLSAWMRDNRPNRGGGDLDQLVGKTLIKNSTAITCPQIGAPMGDANALMNVLLQHAADNDQTQGLLLKAVVYFMSADANAAYPAFRSWHNIGQEDRTHLPFTMFFHNKHVLMSDSEKAIAKMAEIRNNPNSYQGGHGTFGVQTPINAVFAPSVAETLKLEITGHQAHYAAAYKETCQAWINATTPWKPKVIRDAQAANRPYRVNMQEAYAFQSLVFQATAGYAFTETQVNGQKVTKTPRDDQHFWYAASYNEAGNQFAVNHFEANPPGGGNHVVGGLTYQRH
jgi:hypothetical protein